MYIHGYKSPESKQNSNFKLGHARRKCQAGEKNKNEINKEYEMRNEINFFCLIANNASFEKQ